MEQSQTTGVRRRLSDRIEEAFEQACRQGQLEVAACMLKGLDQCLLGQPTPWERRQTALALLRTCAAQLDRLRDAQAGAPSAVSTPFLQTIQGARREFASAMG